MMPALTLTGYAFFSFRRACCCLLLGVLLVGCHSTATAPHYAPVIDAWRQPISKQGVHTVQSGETLYEIAWRYGFDYREVASINHVAKPYKIYAGQKLYLVKPAAQGTTYQGPREPLKSAKELGKNNAGSRTKPSDALSDMHSSEKAQVPSSRLVWQWPAKGVVIKRYFSSGISNKGIDIAGQAGAPVVASAGGEVVYSGNGLLSYGNLIIIKHNEEYLSAYAHNKVNLVTEGMKIKKGQKIAEMGNTGGARRVVLHFEIRRAGRPVDPLPYLPRAGKEVSSQKSAK